MKLFVSFMVHGMGKDMNGKPYEWVIDFEHLVLGEKKYGTMVCEGCSEGSGDESTEREDCSHIAVQPPGLLQSEDFCRPIPYS